MADRLTRVVIVDDHAVIRDGLAMLVNDQIGWEVCGEASDIVDALKVIEESKPNIAIIDVSLKTGNGIELVKEVSSRFPDVISLVWSMFDESLFAERAIRAGASGYINKKYVREDMIPAMKTVLAGNVYLSPEYSLKVLSRLKTANSVETKLPSDVLSDRELEAFALVGQGCNTTEIATRMDLTVSTVETYKSRIKEKLQLDNASQLIREATLWMLENG